jgi:uncharacterized membrane protein
MRSLAGIACQLIHAVFLHAGYVASATGLLVFSLLSDLISLGTDDPQFWSAAALYTLVGGCLGVLASALSSATVVPSPRDSVSRRLARRQIALNLGATVLCVLNLWGRIDTGSNQGMPLALSVLALLMLSAAGWLHAPQQQGVIIDSHAVNESEPAPTSDVKPAEKAATTSTSALP